MHQRVPETAVTSGKGLRRGRLGPGLALGLTGHLHPRVQVPASPATVTRPIPHGPGGRLLGDLAASFSGNTLHPPPPLVSSRVSTRPLALCPLEATLSVLVTSVTHLVPEALLSPGNCQCT